MPYSHSDAVSFIWSVCNIIRDQGWHQSDYGDLILPFTVLRRLDAAAAPKRGVARDKRSKAEKGTTYLHPACQATQLSVGLSEVRVSI